ncbi:MAG TPA: ATP-binding protein [Gemmataceae bacterium]|jgi:PAS domain S-box-containing protein|nr:ATP-binding protein [Gemmataceae bacterium]
MRDPVPFPMEHGNKEASAPPEGQFRAQDEQLRFQLDLVNTLVSRAAEALVVTDAEGRVTFMNAAAEHMFGWTQEELRGKNLHNAIHYRYPDGRPFPLAECEIREVLASGKTLPHHDDLFFRRDGTPVPVSCSKSAIVGVDGKVTGIVLVAIDISERKRLEDELRRRAAELAEADRHKDEFLAVLGHELRNPLAPIRNVLHVLHLRGADPPTLAWAHEVTQRQLRHLTRLVDDLLDVSRINRGKLRLRCERVDLGQLVVRTVEDHRSELEEAGLTLRLEVPPDAGAVTGDTTRLAQVVGNLLHNAVKFTDPGGRVTVRVWLDRDSQRAVVTVADTGVGIEPGQLPHVFETFRQEERSLDRNRGGLGLGLALVRGLVEMHGGQVRAASAGIGHGAEVTFWLPLAREAAAAANHPEGLAPAGGRLRILIIEDYRDVAETLQKFLEFSGHQVAVAHSGPAGVAAARQARPDVVLCDLGLPGMDGLAVARALRKDPATAGARLITMSGYGSESDQQRCLEAGFELHLTKPVDPEQLEQVLAAGPAVAAPNQSAGDDGEQGAAAPA